MHKYLIETSQGGYTLWATPDMVPELMKLGEVTQVGRGINELIIDFMMFTKPRTCIELVKGSKEEADKSFFLDRTGVVENKLDANLKSRINTQEIAKAIIQYVDEGAAQKWVDTQAALPDNG